LREACEEIAPEPRKVDLAGIMSGYYYTGAGYSLKPVIGVVSSGLSFRVDAGEVQSVLDESGQR